MTDSQMTKANRAVGLPDDTTIDRLILHYVNNAKLTVAFEYEVRIAELERVRTLALDCASTYREALQFYAERENHKEDRKFLSAVHSDGGKIARKALEQEAA